MNELLEQRIVVGVCLIVFVTAGIFFGMANAQYRYGWDRALAAIWAFWAGGFAAVALMWLTVVLLAAAAFALGLK